MSWTLHAKVVAAVLLVLFLATSAFAQHFPTKPVRWIIPYAAGGFIDIRVRQIATLLAKRWGQSVVVINQAGASGLIGTNLVAKAPADGYTIGSGNIATMATNVSLKKSMPYDPLTDLASVVLIEKAPMILMVNLSVPAKSVAELVALAKANPGKYTFGSSGVGGGHHLAGEVFRSLAGIDISHVPYKGGAPAAIDLLGGHLSMMFELTYAALPSIKEGKIRPLAVTTEKRFPQTPELPTFVESGYPGLVMSTWHGVVVPAATPREIIDLINESVNQVLAMASVRESILAQANEVGGGTPESFNAFVRAEISRWAKVVKDARIEPE